MNEESNRTADQSSIEPAARAPWSIPEDQWDEADAGLPRILRESIRIGRGMDGGNDVAYVPPNKGQRATACLIAAAPDLLAALRELIPHVVFHNRECTVFQVGGICDDEDCGGSKRRAMAQAAIDKAEGRSDG